MILRRRDSQISRTVQWHTVLNPLKLIQKAIQKYLFWLDFTVNKKTMLRLGMSDRLYIHELKIR